MHSSYVRCACHTPTVTTSTHMQAHMKPHAACLLPMEEIILHAMMLAWEIEEAGNIARGIIRRRNEDG